MCVFIEQRRIKTNKLLHGDIKDNLFQILPNIETDCLELDAIRVEIEDKYISYRVVYRIQ